MRQLFFVVIVSVSIWGWSAGCNKVDSRDAASETKLPLPSATLDVEDMDTVRLQNSLQKIVDAINPEKYPKGENPETPRDFAVLLKMLNDYWPGFFELSENEKTLLAKGKSGEEELLRLIQQDSQLFSDYDVELPVMVLHGLEYVQAEQCDIYALLVIYKLTSKSRNALASKLEDSAEDED